MSRSAEPLQLMSPQAYLAFEETSVERHEYVDGVIHALPGETIKHNQIAGRLYAALLSHADRRGCRVAFEGVKLWIPSLNRYYYPDVMVLCDPRGTDDKIFQYPCVIAEVFSPGTEAKLLPSLKSEFWTAVLYLCGGNTSAPKRESSALI